MSHGRSVVAIAIALLLAACGSGSDRAATSTTVTKTTRPPAPLARDADPAYAHAGPDVVALTQLATTGRTIDVFYPGRTGSETGKDHATYDIREALHDPSSKPLSSDPDQLVSLPAYDDLPPAPGRFPVVLFSHGFGTQPLENATLEADVAAWGFVVIAPDITERDSLALIGGKATIDDARDAHTLVEALNTVHADATIGAMLDMTKVAAVGHAQGGATALAALSLPEVDTAVAWASVPPAHRVAAKPVMLIGAQRDLEYGTRVQERIYAGLRGPARLVLLGARTGNGTFTDACEDERTSGLLIPGDDVVTDNHLLDLATNGCFPDELDPKVAWPVIAHFTVAQLRAVFGIDKPPVGLGPTMSKAFRKVPLVYEQRS